MIMALRSLRKTKKSNSDNDQYNVFVVDFCMYVLLRVLQKRLKVVNKKRLLVTYILHYNYYQFK